MTLVGATVLAVRVAVVRKKLRRRGNSIDLHLSPELLFALGLDIQEAGDAEVDIVLVEDGLLIKPVAGKVASHIPPAPLVHPATRELLWALRDLGPARPSYLAAVLGRERPSVHYALTVAGREGWARREKYGWVISDEAREWFSHMPVREWGEPDVPMPKVARGLFQERLLELLGSEPRTVADLAQEVESDRSQTHYALLALERDGLAVRVAGRPVRWRRA